MKENLKKIKSQKMAALFLIFVPLIILISFVLKTDFQENSTANYLMILALAVLMICGGIGLKNSLRREKN
jgi:uncharacterized membrane protein